jgi:hypothetical protein
MMPVEAQCSRVSGRPVTSGAYLARAVTGESMLSQKLVMLKCYPTSKNVCSATPCGVVSRPERYAHLRGGKL